MNPKALLIPIAAFAVTVTGVQAFNSDLLYKAGLDEQQIAAFEVARELREEGDKEGARDVLIDAGVDLETMKRIHEAVHEQRHAMHEAMETALAANDFAAFKVAVVDSPLADIITTTEDFALFKEAHELKEAGQFDEARAIMEELGFDGPKLNGMGHGMGHFKGEGGNHFGHGKQSAE